NLIGFFEKCGAEALMITDTHKEKLQNEMLDQLLDADIKVLLMNHPHDMSETNAKKGVSVHDIQIEDLLNREVIVTDNCEVQQMLQGKTVLVTGAAGSIGSEIVMQVAAARPLRLLLLDQAESPLHEIQLKLQSAFPELNLEVYICDIRNLKRMEALFKEFKPNFVYHAAAYKHVPMMENHPCESVMVNIVGTRHVVDLSVKYGADRFVMVSTDKAVNPTNVMGCSKRIAEIYVQSLYLELAKKSAAKTKIITTRFGNVLGSNGSVVPLFKNQIAKGGPITVTHKDIIRYFMTIPEACRLVLEAGCMGKGGEIFVFDMGAPVKIYDMAKRMIRLAGLTPGKDIEIVETGLRPGEKLYEELLNDEEQTLPTHHQKILIAKVREYEYALVRESVEDLREMAVSGEKMATVGAMKSLVPEFLSKNSEYEILDDTRESRFA
ncbi:MAG: UDP-N-acetylglucosamine 4,6-dehydratase family protein, partial [Bacteroidales bacterium]